MKYQRQRQGERCAEELVDFNGMSTRLVWFGLWHINLCRLFNAKAIPLVLLFNP